MKLKLSRLPDFLDKYSSKVIPTVDFYAVKEHNINPPKFEIVIE
ncbi:hypothetical protein [Desulfuromusa kysingii]|nr:hypothetical protein [Desulfuromusa kysingii]